MIICFNSFFRIGYNLDNLINIAKIHRHSLHRTEGSYLVVSAYFWEAVTEELVADGMG